MFSVDKIEYVNKTFRLPNEMIEKLEVLAKSNKISLNKLVIQCCKYALDNLKE